jgi:hypothetical protein
MALIPIYCSNESCKHLGFVSVETLPRVLTCSSCGLQSLHAPRPVSATKDCQFAIGKWQSHPSLGREREQYSVVGINRESVTVKCPVDPRYGRFSGSPRCRLPHGLIAQ